MNKLTFSSTFEKQLGTEINARDYADFIHDLLDHTRLNEVEGVIYLQKHFTFTVKESLMTHKEIWFMIGDESYAWQSFRAIDFSCANRGFKKGGNTTEEIAAKKPAELTLALIQFLDKQKFTKKEIRDTEYIADKICDYPDYYGGPDFTPDQAMILANAYHTYKSFNVKS